MRTLVPMRFALALSFLLLASPIFGQPYFTDVVGTTGLGNYVAIPADGHSPAGVFADLNRDGFPDLYLMGVPQTQFIPTVANVVYENVPSGGGRAFQELTGPNNGSLPILANGAIAADYDNDRDLDLYVVTFGDNVLLQNQWMESGQTQLSFIDVTASTDPTPGIADDQVGLGYCVEPAEARLDRTLTAAWADIDRDGDLDLYVGNHDGYWDVAKIPPGPVAAEDGIAGERDCLYRNDGVGAGGVVTFTDITATAGQAGSPGVGGFETATGAIQTPFQRYSSTNAVIFADLNDDRWPDLVVSNKVAGDTDRDLLYINQGAAGGTWLGYAPVTYTMPTVFGDMSPGAMGVDVGDPDNDGDFDIYFTDVGLDPASLPPHLQHLAPLLFNDLWYNQFNDSGGTLDFQHSTELPATWSWGAQWQDYDNDGDEDVHVASSGLDFLYENTLPGFVDQALPWGVQQLSNSRGDMTADYDCDGWVDIFTVNHNSLTEYVNYMTTMTVPLAPSRLWQNNLAQLYPQHHFLSVRLVGKPALTGTFKSSRDAIGARLELTADVDGDGSNEVQIREVRSGSSNSASTSSLEVEFGLGLATSGTLRIKWPSGRTTTRVVNADQKLVVREGPGNVIQVPHEPMFP